MHHLVVPLFSLCSSQKQGSPLELLHALVQLLELRVQQASHIHVEHHFLVLRLCLSQFILQITFESLVFGYLIYIDYLKVHTFEELSALHTGIGRHAAVLRLQLVDQLLQGALVNTCKCLQFDKGIVRVLVIEVLVDYTGCLRL